MATIRSPLRSMRETISPTRPRSTASGLQMTRVRSIARTLEGHLFLGVVLHRRAEVDTDVRVVAHDPAVVASRDVVGVTGPGLELSAVVHLDVDATRHHVALVRNLTRVSAGDRLHRLRPPPARLERRPSDHDAADCRDLQLALRELSDVVLANRFASAYHAVPPSSVLVQRLTARFQPCPRRSDDEER